MSNGLKWANVISKINFTFVPKLGIMYPYLQHRKDTLNEYKPILFFIQNPMSFYDFCDNKCYHWSRKKKGIFSKHIEYEWDKVDPVDREMINKVKVKKGFFNS